MPLVMCLILRDSRNCLKNNYVYVHDCLCTKEFKFGLTALVSCACGEFGTMVLQESDFEKISNENSNDEHPSVVSNCKNR